MLKNSLLAAIACAGLSLAMAGAAAGAPLGFAGAAVPEGVVAETGSVSDMIVKTQARRGVRMAPGVRGGRVVRGPRGVYRGGVYRGGVYRGGGFDPGAAAAVGIIGGVLGAMGAAAAADSGYYYPAPAPVYGGCYWARQPMYDDWGNYLGRRRVQICN